MVINFIARDNEAQQLTFDILTQKLELFGDVFDASNDVLHRADSGRPELLVGALGASFQKRLESIYELSRTVEEVEEELRTLRDEMDSERKRFEAVHERTAAVIESSFDEQVRRAFKTHENDLPAALLELDQDLERVTLGFLRAAGVDHELTEDGAHRRVRVAASQHLPPTLREGLTVTIGPSKDPEAESLHVGHPLVRAAIEDTRREAAKVQGVTFFLPADAPAALESRRGETAQYLLLRATYAGFESVQELHGLLIFPDGECVEGPEAVALLGYRCEDAPHLRDLAPVGAEEIEDGVQDWLFDLPPYEETPEQSRYERAMQQLERFLDDRALLLKQERLAVLARIAKAESARATVLGAMAHTRADETLKDLEQQKDDIEAQIERLEGREDKDFQRLRDRVLKKRFVEPRIERLIDVPVRLS